MVYIWRVPEDYPQSLFGEYQREGAPDRFLLKRGEHLPAQFGVPVIRFDGVIADLRKFDCLANNALVPLVNARCAAILTEVASKDVQFIPTRVEAADGVTDEFSLLNVTSKVKCIDRERSVFSFVPGTQQIMSFRKLEYFESCLGEHRLARDSDYLGHLLLDDAASMRLRGCTGIALRRPSEIAW